MDFLNVKSRQCIFTCSNMLMLVILILALENVSGSNNWQDHLKTFFTQEKGLNDISHCTFYFLDHPNKGTHNNISGNNVNVTYF